MANLTLAIDDELLRSARVKAVQLGTSVNDVCREAIERFAADGSGDDFLRELRVLSARGRRRAKAVAASADARPPSRQALMDEALQQRLPTLLGPR